VNWSFGSGNNTCGSPWGFNCPQDGGDNRRFHLVIADNAGFSNPIVDANNIVRTATSYTTSASDGALTANTTYYVRVCAANYQETCSPTATFTKTAYPSGTVSGNVGEYDPSSGTPYSNGGATGNTSTDITFTPPDTNGVTVTCTLITTGSNPVIITGYTCTVTLDNVNGDPDPTQDFTLAAVRYNSQLYNGLCIQAGATCLNPVTISLDLDSNGGTTVNATQNSYFSIAQGSSYFKLKNVIYQTKSEINSPFPVSALPYDTDDTDGSYLIIGDSAAAYGSVGSALSSESLVLGNGQVSRKSWSNGTYNAGLSLSATRYIDYIRSRKEYQTINSLANLSSEKVNVWSGDLTIDSGNITSFDNKNVILVVTGTLSFNTATYNPTNGSTAFVAKTINMYKDTTFVSEARGIFLADTINLGTSTEPLKVTGNMSSTANAIATGTRRRDDGRKPSLFVVFDPQVYMELLPYFSTVTYEWKEVR
jgi:hypothetical protein